MLFFFFFPLSGSLAFLGGHWDSSSSRLEKIDYNSYLKAKAPSSPLELEATKKWPTLTFCFPDRIKDPYWFCVWAMVGELQGLCQNKVKRKQIRTRKFSECERKQPSCFLWQWLVCYWEKNHVLLRMGFAFWDTCVCVVWGLVGDS